MCPQHIRATLKLSFTLESTMSTITIRLPKGLKTRVAAAAERAGTTAHGFILEAIAEKANQEERSADFHDAAEKRYANIIAAGKTIPWNKMRAYLEARLAGGKAVRPAARKFAR
jgi:predicted transcriptional regulator